ncbi:hypothetical protein ACRRTK_001102 [Alexandromys fortis]
MPLYAVNMFYYHWLTKKLLWACGRQNRVRQEFHAEIEKKRRWSQGDAMQLPKETGSRTLLVVFYFMVIEMG